MSADPGAGPQGHGPDLPQSQPQAGEGQRLSAADLFSVHRPAELVEVFQEPPVWQADVAAPIEDDVIDPDVTSGAPAALAALAPAEGLRDDVVPGAFDPVWATAQVPVVSPAEQNVALPAGVPLPPALIAPREASAGEQEPVWDGEEKPARKGRNMRAATLVGLALLGGVVFTAWWHPIAFAVLLYTAAIGAVIEWKRALEPHGRQVPLVPIIAATLGMAVATLAAKPEGLVVALLVGCAGVVAWRLGDEKPENTLADALAGVLTLLWIPFLASFLLLLELASDGWERVLVVVLAVVANDTGALIVGMRFGRHKLLERVSPAKTWEGAVGGVVLGAIVAGVAAHFFFGEWYAGVAVGAACAIAAVVGDLAESALKRDLRIKDMSSFLPGHGGILDRIDSVLFAGPVGYVVFAVFLGTLGGGGL